MTTSDRPRTKPTLDQVAAAAGVSRATVSRVVNGDSRVRPDARVAVEAAIDQLGYVPNRAARSLVTQRTDSIALIILESDARLFVDPFFSRIVRGVSQSLAGERQQLVLLMAQGDEERSRLERYMASGHVDGALFISVHDDTLPSRLAASGLPVVVGGRPHRADGVSYVDVANRAGARDAVAHLIGLGRRRIATITGPLDMTVSVDRRDGYLDALAAAGLDPDDDLVEEADFTEGGGRLAMQALLRRAPELDAVFAASDLMAAGALGALSTALRDVPGDVAVAGFDDSPLASFVTPALTTVRQPVEEMAAEMTAILLRHIADADLPPEHRLLPTEVVIRGSA